VRFDFSHHPDAPCFREHVFSWKGRYWCKGCVLSLLGLIAGVGLQLTTGWLNHFSEEILGGIFLALVVPTALTSWLDANRPTKHLARFLLGVGLASALMTFFITDRWEVRLILVLAFFGIRIPLEQRRRRQNEEILKQSKAEKARAGKVRNSQSSRAKRSR